MKATTKIALGACYVRDNLAPLEESVTKQASAKMVDAIVNENYWGVAGSVLWIATCAPINGGFLFGRDIFRGTKKLVGKVF
jgi:hypothetical protein